VTAHEQQQQAIVGLAAAGVAHFVDGHQALLGVAGDRLLAPPAGHLAADVIGHPPGGDVDEPGARLVRYTGQRPLGRRRQQRLLHRVLGSGEVTVAAHQRGQHVRRQLAQEGDRRRRRCHGSTGGALITSRTSMARFSGAPPRPGASDARAAIR
jgi:hypothetical protein